MKNILKFKNDNVKKSKEDVEMKTPKHLKKILIGVGAGLGLLVGGVALLAKKVKQKTTKMIFTMMNVMLKMKTKL